MVKNFDVEKERTRRFFAPMSFAEMKRQIPKLTRRQRRELWEVLGDASRANRAGWMDELDRRSARMDAGEKHTLEDFQRRHRELSSESDRVVAVGA